MSFRDLSIGLHAVRVIVRDKRFSYSVDLKQIYGSIGQPFHLRQSVRDEYKQYRGLVSNTAAFLYLKKNVEGMDEIHFIQEIRKITIRPMKNWALDLLEFELLPFMSTLANLDTVLVRSSECFARYTSLGQRSNIHELQKNFQFPSVRHLEFIGEAKDLSNDIHTAFLCMFPNLDTLVNPPIQCLKQIGNHFALSCPRKLVLLHTVAEWTNEIVKCIHQWQNLDALFIRYEDGTRWPIALLDGLAKHKSLRHLCIIIEPRGDTCCLPARETIEGLVDAWSNRNWMSMFFIWNPLHRVNCTCMISAIHEDNGSIKYEEMRGVKYEKIVLAFPQFYTLFWQYVLYNILCILP